MSCGAFYRRRCLSTSRQLPQDGRRVSRNIVLRQAARALQRFNQSAGSKGVYFAVWSVGLADLDAKRFFRVSKLADGRLTFAELEATACLGATGLFAFHLSGIASHESFCAECLFVVGVDLDECAGNGQT